MLFVSQEEWRASDTVLFTGENNDIANQSVDTPFFIIEKNRMTNQLVSLARRNYFYLDAFWRVNVGMYMIKEFARAFSYACMELWMHLGSLESTQEARVLRIFRALQTS